MIKRLILAPHCDDETLGCGGLLAKYGPECAVVVATAPDDTRYAEFMAAQKILGTGEVHWLHRHDGYVGQDMHSLVGELDQVVAKYQPLEMYVPFPSSHQDHIAIYEGGLRAGRLSMTEGHHFTPSIFVYDVAAYDVNLYPSDLQWNIFESLTEDQIDRKVAALECYASQAITGPHPVNLIKEQARATGASRRVEYAEPFALVRAVRV